MSEETLIKTVNWLFALASVFLFHGLILIDPYYEESKLSPPPIFLNILPKGENEPKRVLFPKWTMLDTIEQAHYGVKAVIEEYVDIETEYIGEYFITAYCPEECGWSWSTSSGATCHYSDDPMVPTTCAIDRNYHGYGEYLMIDGKIYVTEDTGPGVKGRWIDCFVETMDEVNSWDTGWKSVYSVTFVTKERYVLKYAK